MKKFIAVMTAAAMLTSLSACGASASTASSAAESTASSAAADSTSGSTADATTYKVAIVQQLDHASLDEIRTAIEAELDAKAAEKGITIEYKDFNGQNDATTLNQIGTQVVSDGYDAVIPIATLAAQCMTTACESTKTPVIYAAISDPAAADLTDIDYVTGTSDALNTQSIMDMIFAVQPEAKTIGIVYTTSEANSVYSVKVYEEKAAEYGFTIASVGVTAQSEVTQAVDTLIAKGVDCFSNLTDNNVVGVLSSILEKTNEAGIPVYGSEIEQMKLGCVAGAGLDYVQLGIQTGKMAAKILTGEATCQDLPYEVIENYSLYVNSNALAQMGITLPDDLAQEAEEVGATA